MAKLNLYSHVNAVSKQPGHGSLLSALFVWISALVRSFPVIVAFSNYAGALWEGLFDRKEKKRKPKKEKEDEEK